MAKVAFKRYLTKSEAEASNIVDGQFIVTKEGDIFVDYDTDRIFISETPTKKFSGEIVLSSSSNTISFQYPSGFNANNSTIIGGKIRFKMSGGSYANAWMHINGILTNVNVGDTYPTIIGTHNCGMDTTGIEYNVELYGQSNVWSGGACEVEIYLKKFD